MFNRLKYLLLNWGAHRGENLLAFSVKNERCILLTTVEDMRTGRAVVIKNCVPPLVIRVKTGFPHHLAKLVWAGKFNFRAACDNATPFWLSNLSISLGLNKVGAALTVPIFKALLRLPSSRKCLSVRDTDLGDGLYTEDYLELGGTTYRVVRDNIRVRLQQKVQPAGDKRDPVFETVFSCCHSLYDDCLKVATTKWGYSNPITVKRAFFKFCLDKPLEIPGMASEISAELAKA